MALRVTFVTPHRRATSGGVHAIERFASGLADTMRVALVVQKGAPGELPGVTVSAGAALEAAQLPDADVLVVPADSGAGERLYEMPRRKGRQVLLFQGYGIPGSPIVTANLERADLVVAVASWLVEDAEAHGARAVHVPYGLDRRTFAPGPPADQRAPVASLLVHGQDWKGTADGLSALAETRRAMPETQVRLFGGHRPDSEFPFLGTLDRGQVAELLRRSGVFVCASWEEGFGLPGLEALACGAALATTDTKGSRDYAVHGRTALVSEPHDRDALAANVLKLLRDRSLRASLAAAGCEYVHGNFGTWAQASTYLAAALERFAATPAK